MYTYVYVHGGIQRGTCGRTSLRPKPNPAALYFDHSPQLRPFGGEKMAMTVEGN